MKAAGPLRRDVNSVEGDGCEVPVGLVAAPHACFLVLEMFLRGRGPAPWAARATAPLAATPGSGRLRPLRIDPSPGAAMGFVNPWGAVWGS